MYYSTHGHNGAFSRSIKFDGNQRFFFCTNWMAIRPVYTDSTLSIEKSYDTIAWSWYWVILHGATGLWQHGAIRPQNTKMQNFLSIRMFCLKRERRRSDSVIWQNPLYQQKIRKPKDNTQTPPKTSITQRLRTDLGRSVGVTSHPTSVVKPVYGYPSFPLTASHQIIWSKI